MSRRAAPGQRSLFDADTPAPLEELIGARADDAEPTDAEIATFEAYRQSVGKLWDGTAQEAPLPTIPTELEDASLDLYTMVFSMPALQGARPVVAMKIYDGFPHAVGDGHTFAHAELRMRPDWNDLNGIHRFYELAIETNFCSEEDDEPAVYARLRNEEERTYKLDTLLHCGPDEVEDKGGILHCTVRGHEELFDPQTVTLSYECTYPGELNRGPIVLPDREVILRAPVSVMGVLVSKPFISKLYPQLVHPEINDLCDLLTNIFENMNWTRPVYVSEPVTMQERQYKS